MTQPSGVGSAVLPLDDIRVLDLSGLIGQYAARLLADQGADVIRVESPAGSAARRHPPFYHDTPDTEQSLSFWYFNANKRSITLDLACDDGRALFWRLLETADAVVDGLGPGVLAGLGFAAARVSQRLPRLIWAEISGFGASGPHRDFLTTDLIGLAMSGVLTLSGFPDRAPTLLPGEQGYLCASLQAAQGVLLALLARDAGAGGQRVEVSMQEALSLAQETAMQTYDIRGEVRRRSGDAHLLPGVGTYRCADGYVNCMIGVAGFGAPWSVLAAWMDERGMAGDLTDEPWQRFLNSMNLRELTALQADPERLAEYVRRFQHVEQLVQAFMLAHTKAELYETGQSRRLLIGPVNSARDLIEDAQLQAREWYHQVAQPAAHAPVVYPGPPFRASAVPWRIRRPPPRLGEHNIEIYEHDLGLSRDQLAILAGAGVI